MINMKNSRTIADHSAHIPLGFVINPADCGSGRAHSVLAELYCRIVVCDSVVVEFYFHIGEFDSIAVEFFCRSVRSLSGMIGVDSQTGCTGFGDVGHDFEVIGPDFQTIRHDSQVICRDYETM